MPLNVNVPDNIKINSFRIYNKGQDNAEEWHRQPLHTEALITIVSIKFVSTVVKSTNIA